MVVSGILVADAMTTEPVTCNADLTLKDVAKLMAEQKVGSVLIVEEKKIIGIITEEDFVHRVVAGEINPNTTLVKDCMTKKLITAAPSMGMLEAMNLMKKKDLRRLPVVEHGQLKGMLTFKDLIRIQPELIEIANEMNVIRESHRKPLPEEDEQLGQCESCGNFGLIKEDSGQKLCRICNS